MIVCYPKLHWPGIHDVLETGLADRVMIVSEYDVVAGPPETSLAPMMQTKQQP